MRRDAGDANGVENNFLDAANLMRRRKIRENVSSLNSKLLKYFIYLFFIFLLFFTVFERV